MTLQRRQVARRGERPVALKGLRVARIYSLLVNFADEDFLFFGEACPGERLTFTVVPPLMTIYDTAPLGFEAIRTYPLAKRGSKVSVAQFARPHRRGAPLAEFLAGLPRILAADDLRAVVAAVERARRSKRPILWGLGGHVIKVGLAPVLIDLLRRGYISGLAMNGAALIHDFEIALVGNTSEDVEAVLGRGKFGMAEETGLYLNEMAVGAARGGIGLGEAAGKLLSSPRLGAKFPECSVILAAYRARVPVTVHLAIGTDIPHMHRSADGAALGTATHRDFRLFCALVKKMHPGGVYLNWGSAVILPEVFLKAVSVARNLGTRPGSITTANFDFLQHYRPQQNVVRRPTADRGSRGYALTGHHEILLPLLAAALIESGGSGRAQRRGTSSRHPRKTPSQRKR